MNGSNTDFETNVTLENNGNTVADDTPFNLLILGDWSGGVEFSFDINTLSKGFIEIDRDNFDEVFRSLNVSVNLDFQANDLHNISIKFGEFDDFHPDNIFRQLPLFSELRLVRERLINPDTFQKAASEVRAWISSENEFDNHTFIDPRANQEDDSLNLLDAILDKKTEEKNSVSDLDTFIKNIVKPHLIKTDYDELARLLLIVDEVISDVMRKILHHSKFQSLEAAWRGLFFLIRRTETDSNLKVFIMNIDKDALGKQLKTVSKLEESSFYKAVSSAHEQRSEPPSWSLITGDYSFSLNVEDVATLMRIGEIARELEAPFVTAISPEAFGLNSFDSADQYAKWQIPEGSTEDQLWSMLRVTQEAQNLGLVLPRFMSRLPYGEKTEPIESFNFEEFTSVAEHNAYLWSNSIFVVSLLFAEMFSSFGWELSENLIQDVDRMLTHFSRLDGVECTKPSAEVNMKESNCNQLISNGFMPVISFKNSDSVRLMSFQSIASPSTFIKGKWN